MRHGLICSFLFVVTVMLTVTTTAAAAESAGTLTLDSERSTIEWVSEAPSEKIVGTASEIEAEVVWDLDDLAATNGTISFPVSSMRTGNSLRDRHLQGRDWLRADDNPDIVFEITGLEDIERTRQDDQIRVEATAVGHVVVNGERAESRATVSIAILPDTQRVRIQPELQVRLEEHNIEGRRGSIGKEVGESIDITGVLYGSWE